MAGVGPVVGSPSREHVAYIGVVPVIRLQVKLLLTVRADFDWKTYPFLRSRIAKRSKRRLRTV